MDAFFVLLFVFFDFLGVLLWARSFSCSSGGCGSALCGCCVLNSLFRFCEVVFLCGC